MNHLIKLILCATLGLVATISFASPTYLITHNKTNVESNAYIDGTIPSPHPTKANDDSKILWAAVRMVCWGHTTDNKCSALIKMGTNTSTPVDLGTVQMDLNTGDITPKKISANGFTLTVNGPGESTLTKN